MALLDYNTRLDRLQQRRFDQELRRSTLTESFKRSTLSKSTKYLLESMMPIGSKYNEKTKEAAKRVQKHLEAKLELHFNRAYRSQGSMMTDTNIKVHSDFDLLTIIDRYHYNAADVETTNTYTDSDPNLDIKDLRKQSTSIMKNIYDEVDDSGTKSIAIFNKSLNRKVDIVFCYWFHTSDYVQTQNEYYRGVYLYDFPKETKIKDYPFAHIKQVNNKGDNSNDGSRKSIRLLKSLKSDSDQKIDLSSFHITTIVHNMPEADLYYDRRGKEILIAKNTSDYIERLIEDQNLRSSLTSPNGTEKPFNKDGKVEDLKKMKLELDNLLIDVYEDINDPINKNKLILY